MAGLFLILIVVMYALAARWLLTKTKPVWAKALVLIAAILLPIADDMYYRRKLDAYCQNEAGFKIYQQVSRKEGLVDNSASGHGEDYLKITPVAFVEWTNVKNGEIRYWRTGRLSDGNFKTSEVTKFSAPYEYKRVEERIGGFVEVQLMVTGLHSEMPIGLLKTRNYYGGWFYRSVLGTFSDGGAVLVANCEYGGASKDHIELINRVFSKE